MDNIPSGFQLLRQMDEVTGAFAPIFIRPNAAGDVTLGFRVGRQHCNPRGHCHGGTWATMADIALGINIGLLSGLSGPTVSMSLDFLGAAKIGQWVEGTTELLRATPNLGFAECRFTADGELALRANGVFRRKFEAFRDVGALVARS